MRQAPVSPVPASSPEKQLQSDQERDWLVSVSQMQLVNAKLCRLSTGIRDILFISAGDTKKP